ncbi:catalase [Methylobacterium sp. NEAU 140]|uniref:DUF6894 family protein n=1 Tax=Methylobacterium sp. NEAU 140 TaxID=3064945 RepID=UPI0027325D65|nr:catalase [Methylobacterium sp. NEAU 140]MDP4021804.1 catalase [Methylobacterium sp. NEAU 140]
MIRAHFNIRLDGAVLPDRVGQPVEDLEAARAAARTVVRRLVQRHAGEPRLLDAAVMVTDADGATLVEMSFFEALYQPVEPVAPAEAARRRPAASAARSLMADPRFGAALRPVRRLAEAVGTRVQPLLRP